LHRPTGRYRRSIKKQRKSRPSTSYVICCMFIFGCKRRIACTDKLGLGLRLVNLVWLGIGLVVAVTYRLPGTSPPIGERSTLMIMSVCLSVCVCLSVTISPDLQVRSSPIFVHVTYSRGSVLLWWRCDVSRISSCTDDIIFAHSIPA